MDQHEVTDRHPFFLEQEKAHFAFHSTHGTARAATLDVHHLHGKRKTHEIPDRFLPFRYGIVEETAIASHRFSHSRPTMSIEASPGSHITLAHGNGGRWMRTLIETLFARYLGHPELDTRVDAAPFPLRSDLPACNARAGAGEERDSFASFPLWEKDRRIRDEGESQGEDEQWLITTDGFTVEPLEFPGGNIGSLAVYGTVNDLAVAGAWPLYLSLTVFLEEGLAFDVLERITASLARSCRECGVRVLAGDTKVLRRGQGGGVYLATTGVGRKPTGIDLGITKIQAGDRILVSGPIGDHGTAVLLAREQFGLSGDLRSDAASVLPMAKTLWQFPGVRFLRDPTRGGVATVAWDIAQATGMTVHLQESEIPVRDSVRAVCEILGYDPLYLACEGRLVAVMEAGMSEAAVARLRNEGHLEAAVIGVIDRGPARVVLHTPWGGERILPELEDDPLPRIC